MKTIAITNLKGGVGKTAITFNLAGVLHERGKRVLLLDMDLQCNLTTLFDTEDQTLLGAETNIARVLFDRMPLSDAIKPTKLSNVAIVPADIDLAEIDGRFTGDPDAQFLLAEFLEDQKKNFDYVLIDCPPHLDLSTRMALVACNAYLVPVAADRMAIRGAVRVQELVKSIQKRANPKIQLLGILLSRIVSHRNITDYYLDVCKQQFGDNLLKTVIKELNKFHVAASAGMPITAAQASSAEADIFRSLAEEIRL